MTPEGKIKFGVRKVLSKYKGLYTYWPVPAGYGPSSLDCLLCVAGKFVGIEAKAPGKKPTKRQSFIIDCIQRAGGVVFVIDGPFGIQKLDDFLKEATTHATSSSQHEAQTSRGAI